MENKIIWLFLFGCISSSTGLTCTLKCNWKEERCDLQLEEQKSKWILTEVTNEDNPVISGLEKDHYLHKSEFYTSKLTAGNGETGRAYFTYHKALRNIEGHLKFQGSSYTFSVTGKGNFFAGTYEKVDESSSDDSASGHFAESLKAPKQPLSMMNSDWSPENLDGNVCELNVAVHHSVIRDMGTSDAVNLAVTLVQELTENFDQIILPNGKKIRFTIAFLDLCMGSKGFDPDPIEARSILKNFNSLVRPSGICASILLTKQKIQGNTIGMAYWGTICTDSASALVTVKDDKHTLHTLLHEMGHILGVEKHSLQSNVMFPRKPWSYQASSVWTFEPKSIQAIEEHLEELSGTFSYCLKQENELSKIFPGFPDISLDIRQCQTAKPANVPSTSSPNFIGHLKFSLILILTMYHDWLLQ